MTLRYLVGARLAGSMRCGRTWCRRLSRL